MRELAFKHCLFWRSRVRIELDHTQWSYLVHERRRRLICNACNGDGEVDCGKCQGTGSVPVKCDECKGTGKVDAIDCDLCNGTGKVDGKCTECFGGGAIMCEACDGTGNVADKGNE